MTKNSADTPANTSTTSANETPKGDRIAKVLARAGVASRREAERMIEAGRVSVNGDVITSPALNVLPTDRIVCDGKEVAEAEPARLWLYHKPTGLVTTAKDEKGRETVFDSLPDTLPRVMSVGRLDLNSEGLLLLTNDGELKRKLELPSTGWTRKYRVRVNGRPTDDMLAPVRKGLNLEGERFMPMSVSLDRQQGANAWLTVALTEGKNREIRRAMEAIGLSVNRLLRVSYGPFQLGILKPGEVEEIRPRVLRDQLGLEHDAGLGEPKKKPVRKRSTNPKAPENKWQKKTMAGKPGRRISMLDDDVHERGSKSKGRGGPAGGRGKPSQNRGAKPGGNRGPNRGKPGGNR